MQLIARTRDPAVGTKSWFWDFHELSFNGAGQAVFDATLQSDLPVEQPDYGIWAGAAELEVVALAGSLTAEHVERAPGFDVNFSNLFTHPVNDRGGRVAFTGRLGPSTEVTFANDTGIWSGPVDALALLAREGAPAPGVPAGMVFDDFEDNFSVIINGGRIAFYATLLGPGAAEGTDEGVWSNVTGSLTLSARAGAAAPGTETTFFGVGFPALNAAGQIAFTGVLNAADPEDTVLGIWMQEPNGVVRLVIRDEDEIRIAGQLRSVSGISTAGTGGEGGRGSGLNDAGQIVLTGTVGAQRGVFVTPGADGGGGGGGGNDNDDMDDGQGAPECAPLGSMCGPVMTPFMLALLVQRVALRRSFRADLRNRNAGEVSGSAGG